MPRELVPARPGPHNTAAEIRQDVLRDTVEQLNSHVKRAYLKAQAYANHQRWQLEAAQKTAVDHRVHVMRGDWGDIALERSKQTGQIYAVLNMANAYTPGGGYLDGAGAQEENMFRRTDCHFSVADEHMNAEKTRYTKKMTDLINAKDGNRVYIDNHNARLCIKGSEKNNVTGYEMLPEDELFQFIELRAAADDLRGGKRFNKESMSNKIRAQLTTLRDNNVRNVVLSAFGCGAFKNPPEKVAALYREVLSEPEFADAFDDVVFAIHHAGYGTDNYPAFHSALENVPLSSKLRQEDHRKLSVYINMVKAIANEPHWDKKGQGFFSKKTPTGILQIRKILNNDSMEVEEKLQKIKAIADDRLKHPPRFTKRDPLVADLYDAIKKSHTTNDDIPQQNSPGVR